MFNNIKSHLTFILYHLNIDFMFKNSVKIVQWQKKYFKSINILTDKYVYIFVILQFSYEMLHKCKQKIHAFCRLNS